MSIANVFLSHSSSDKPLVKMVANALCRRGITPWLDIQRLTAGVSITEKLKEAISQQTAVALFLSKPAAASKWVQEELSEAIHLEEIKWDKRNFSPPYYRFRGTGWTNRYLAHAETRRRRGLFLLRVLCVSA